MIHFPEKSGLKAPPRRLNFLNNLKASLLLSQPYTNTQLLITQKSIDTFMSIFNTASLHISAMYRMWSR